MKNLLVFLCVMAMGCMVPFIVPSVYAEGLDDYSELMIHSDTLGNVSSVSYTEENLSEVVVRNIGIYQIIKVDYVYIRYFFVHNTGSGYSWLWSVSNKGLSLIYGGKEFLVERSE